MLLANTDSDLTIYLEIKSYWAFCGSLLEALGAGRQAKTSCRIVADCKQVRVGSDSRIDKLQLSHEEIAEQSDIRQVQEQGSFNYQTRHLDNVEGIV